MNEIMNNIDDKLSKNELNTLNNQYNNISLNSDNNDDNNNNISYNSSIKKSVKFAHGTAKPREAVVAITISNYENVKAMGYTEYHIQVYRDGNVNTIKRRYRHFEALSKDLSRENALFQIDLPSLPQKRWFQTKRWFNRFDDEYSYDRKQSLQEYLRTLIKIPIVLEKSKALRKFLDLSNDEILKYPDADSLRHFITGESDNSIIIFEPIDYIEENNNYNFNNSSNRYQDLFDYDYNSSLYHSDSQSDDSESDSNIDSRDNSSLSSLELNRILSEKLSVLSISNIVQSSDVTVISNDSIKITIDNTIINSSNYETKDEIDNSSNQDL